MPDDLLRDVESLIRAIEAGVDPAYLFFWGHHPPAAGGPGRHWLSQWADTPFQREGVHYPTAEHFMMAGKARLFGDHEALTRILGARHPGEARKLGRGVQGFDEGRWAAARFELVVQGNLAKFGQAAERRQFLLGTGRRVLVEASPHDRIWGIGMTANDYRAARPDLWAGRNLLGFALMEVRRRLRAES